MSLVQYAACHKNYPLKEKFSAIDIWNSSKISRFVSISLHAQIKEFSCGAGGGGGGGLAIFSPQLILQKSNGLS